MKAAQYPLLCFLLFTGCIVPPVHFSYRFGKGNDDIPGASVAKTIDIQLGPALSVPLEMHVGKAVCPTTLDLSGGKIGRCTLAVGDARVPVSVRSGTQFGAYAVSIQRTAIPMKRIERDERSDLFENYGLRAAVDCGTPRIRIAEAGSRFRCKLRGRRLPSNHIDYKILDSAGRVFVYNLAHVKSRDVAFFSRYLSLHKARRPTIVPGSALAADLHRKAHQSAQDDPSMQQRVGPASCPPRVDLSGNLIAHCIVMIAGLKAPYSAWIDSSGNFQILPDAIVGYSKHLSDTAERFYETKLQAAGLPRRVMVDCGPDRFIMITPRTKLACTLTAGAGPRDLTIWVPDIAKGEVRYYVAPL